MVERWLIAWCTATSELSRLGTMLPLRREPTGELVDADGRRYVMCGSHDLGHGRRPIPWVTLRPSEHAD